MNRYDVREELGDGTFGTVFRAINRDTHEEVAIKRMKRFFRTWKDCASLRELQSLKSLNHAHIVEIREAIRESTEEVYFVFEYMPDGNLYEFLKRCTPRPSDLPGTKRPQLGLAKIQSLTKQVIQGLAYLHARGFIHRDIKPENLLLRGDTIKIADFGLARPVSSPEPRTDYVSTRWYRAPEVLLRSSEYGTAVDLFAMGCILAELHSGLPLFPGESEPDLLDRMIKVLGMPNETTWPEGVRLAKEMGFSFDSFVRMQDGSGNDASESLETKVCMAPSKAIQLMKELLQWDSERRPTANEALQSLYFGSVITPKPRPFTTAEITDSIVKKRSLNMVTASPGYIYDEFEESQSSSNSLEYQSPIPVDEGYNSQASMTKMPRHGDSKGFSVASRRATYA